MSVHCAAPRFSSPDSEADCIWWKLSQARLYANLKRECSMDQLHAVTRQSSCFHMMSWQPQSGSAGCSLLSTLGSQSGGPLSDAGVESAIQGRDSSSSTCLQAVVAGCIPVVIDDDVRFEFEEILPYQEFAIRVPERMIYFLPQLLEELVEKDSDKVLPSDWHARSDNEFGCHPYIPSGQAGLVDQSIGTHSLTAAHTVLSKAIKHPF